MAELHIWPNIDADGVSMVVYAEDGVTQIPAVGGALITLVPEFSGGPPILPAYYRDRLGVEFLTYDPLALSGDPISVPPITRVSGSLTGVVTTALASRAIISDGEVVVTTGYAIPGDGGGAEFRGALGASSGANGYTRINSSNGQWQITDATTLDARQFGVKADGRVCKDGVTVRNSAVLTSGSAAFTQADVGKSILVNTPRELLTGTVSITSGNITLTGSGTAFLTEIPHHVFGSTVPAGGGGLAIGNDGGGYTRLPFRAFNSETSLALNYVPDVSKSGVDCYAELQWSGTIVSVESETQCTLSAPMLVAESGVEFFFYTDDTAALMTAMGHSLFVAQPAPSKVMRLPPGIIGITESLRLFGMSGFRVIGPGHGFGYIKDGRLCSVWYDYGDDDEPAGAIEIYQSDSVVFEDVDYDGSVPVVGMQFSSGGSDNGTGRRSAVVFRDCNDSGLIRCGSRGLGAREEHFEWIGANGARNRRNFCIDVLIEESNGPGVNGNASVLRDFHVHGGFSKSQGWSALLFAGDGRITNFIAAGGDAYNNGADLVFVDAAGQVDIDGLTLVGGDTSGYGSSGFKIRGHASLGTVSKVRVNGLTIRGVQSGWNNAIGAAITLDNCRGSVLLDNVLVDECTAALTGGKFVHVLGANTTARIKIGSGCMFRGRAGSNMTVGVTVASSVPDGLVEISEGVSFVESVTTPLVTAKNLAPTGDVQTISSTGTTAARLGAKTIVVDVDGSVTATLWSPALTPGRRVTLRNTATQTGTTTVGTDAGTIDGDATIVGAGSRTYEAFGSTWQLLGSV